MTGFIGPMKSKQELEIEACKESIAHYKQRLIERPQNAKQINIWIQMLQDEIDSYKNGDYAS